MAAENTAQNHDTSHVVNLLVKRHDEIINLWIKDRLDSGEFESPAFDEMRVFLNEISRPRAVKGYTPLENATYILSLRNTLLPLLAEELDGNNDALVREMQYFTSLLDKMGLVMVENFIRSREEI